MGKRQKSRLNQEPVGCHGLNLTFWVNASQLKKTKTAKANPFTGQFILDSKLLRTILAKSSINSNHSKCKAGVSARAETPVRQGRRTVPISSA